MIKCLFDSPSPGTSWMALVHVCIQTILLYVFQALVHVCIQTILLYVFQGLVPFIFVGTVENISNAKILLEYNLDHLRVSRATVVGRPFMGNQKLSLSSHFHDNYAPAITEISPTCPIKQGDVSKILKTRIKNCMNPKKFYELCEICADFSNPCIK